jgi:hypothetical protein
MKEESNRMTKDQSLITLNSLIEDSPLTVTQLMELCEFKRFTWYNRIKQPEKFTVEEIEKIAEVLLNVAHLFKKPETITPSLVFEAIRNQIKATRKNTPLE